MRSRAQRKETFGLRLRRGKNVRVVLEHRHVRGNIMVHFVGAGPGAADLITIRGRKLLEEADVVIYAGSLVNPELLKYTKSGCAVYNSAELTLEEVIGICRNAENDGLDTVRLHTGDPCLYGAVREQMDLLEKLGIAYDSCPGVSSFCGAASVMNLEYTLPDVSQTVILSRMAGRTPVPEKERIRELAFHHATMVLFLSVSMTEELSVELIRGGYDPDTPAAVVCRATWPDEITCICTVGTLSETVRTRGITRTALIIIGDAVSHSHYRRSDLYHPDFSTMFREARTGKPGGDTDFRETADPKPLEIGNSN